jgi:hypothetical protein
MTRKPNFAKFLLGTCVLALLFIGAWATTRVPLTSAKKSDASITTSASAIPKMVPGLPGPLSPATGTDLVTSVIELDGDITDNPAGAPDDWDTINCDGGTAAAKTGVIVDGTNKSIFTGGGSKDNINIPSWKWKDGSTPPKDDLINGYAAKFVGATGDTILAFGAERSSNNGTAFIGVWFFKSEVSLNADFTFNGVHSIGDILVLNTFTQGGSFATAKVYEWVGEGGTCAAGDTLQKGGNLCDITNSAPAGSVLSISNASPITIPPASYASCPWAYPGGTVPTNAFFEGGINLSAFPALADACFSSFLIETRSSSVVDAVLKDFIIGQFDTCPDITLTKTADDTVICDGTPTEYTYNVTNPTALNLTITLVDDNETPGNLTDDLDVLAGCTSYNLTGTGTLSTAVVGPGDTAYTCTRTLAVGAHTNIAKVTASIAGASSEATATETVNVYAAPTANAGDDQSVCLNSGFGTHDFVLNGSVTNGTASWSLVGGNTAGCSVFSGGSSLTPTVRCTAFGTATARLTSTSSAPSGTNCPNATDDVLLTIRPNATAAAGDDQSVCVDDTFTSTDFSLSGTVTNATASWSFVGANTANCTFLNPPGAGVSAPTVRCTAIGTATARLLATSSNSCTNATDDLVLTVNANPEAAAGPDDFACSAGATTPFTLAGSAGNGTSLWTCVGGNCGQVSITTPGSPTSGVVFTGTGSATLKITTTSVSCGTAEDTVVLTVDPNPTVTICGDEACSTDEVLALTANVSPAGGSAVTYSWTGPGITSATNLQTITVNLPGTYTVSVTRKASAGSDACPGSTSTHVGLCAQGAACAPPAP